MIRERGSRVRAASNGGFTLLELMVAITILATTIVMTNQVLSNTVRSRDFILEDLESPKIANAMLDQLFKDFRFLYYRAGQLADDSGFWGRTRQVAGHDGDRVDFITARTSRVAELENATDKAGLADSPLTEVGYACRPNDSNSNYIELWRREDYFVDDDPTDGGKYSLIYDRVRKFNLRYYPPPEENTDLNGLEDWDSKNMKKVPYAIILEMDFDAKDVGDGRGRELPEPQHVVRIIVLKAARSLPLDAGMGMTPAGMTGM